MTELEAKLQSDMAVLQDRFARQTAKSDILSRVLLVSIIPIVSTILWLGSTLGEMRSDNKILSAQHMKLQEVVDKQLDYINSELWEAYNFNEKQLDKHEKRGH